MGHCDAAKGSRKQEMYKKHKDTGGREMLDEIWAMKEAKRRKEPGRCK